MSSPRNETEARILEAARTVFVREGTRAASLKQIAREADVNQALLHYYFRDKETLANTIFEEVASEFIPRIQEVFVSDQPIEKKVKTIVQKYYELLRENPYLPAYLIGELNQNPEGMRERIHALGVVPFDDLDVLEKQLQEEAEAGRIRPISAQQFITNLVSLCVFPFIARPLLEAIFDMEDDAFDQFVEERQKTLPAFVMDSLRPC